MGFIRALGGLLKVVLPIVVAIGLLGLIIAWLAGVFEEKIQPGKLPAVEQVVPGDPADKTEVVEEVVKEYYSEAVGTLKSSTRAEISARIMAPITEIRVKAGDAVKTDQLLITLDRRDAESRHSQAEASLESARASLSQAENDFKRDKEMFDEKVIAARRFEQTKTALDVARANMKRAEQAVTEANVVLSYTVIKAPQNGTIVDRLAEPGDIASPGVPLLVLYDPASLRLEVPVMENLALKLKLGDALTVHIDALDRDVAATVDEIVPQAEAASRSFLVKVALHRSDDLYEGMFGRLRIPVGTRRHLCMPLAAIQTIGQLQFVDVLEPDGHSLERRLITTGRVGVPGHVEVLSGLNAGDRVVLPTTPKK